MSKKILIQGFEGSFHQLATTQYFKEKIEFGFCKSFKDIFDRIEKNKTYEGAVMAIENSIAGSILNNYTLLKNSKLIITGEIYLKIKQNLIANKGTHFKDITEIHSHPIAILQCMDFLAQYNWKLVETEDTALSIKYIEDNKYKHIAGIAGHIASDLFDMKILKTEINSMKDNFTRFLILERKNAKHDNSKCNKASIQFEVQQEKSGSLAQVLNRIYYHNINLTKLQSFPIPGSKWEYYFHTDMEFKHINNFNTVIKDLKHVTKNIRIYGIYEKGKTI